MTAWLIGAGLGLLGFIAGCVVMSWQHADDYVDGFEDCADLLNEAVSMLEEELVNDMDPDTGDAWLGVNAALATMNRVLGDARRAREDAPLQ
jgi:hypothetical protein